MCGKWVQMQGFNVRECFNEAPYSISIFFKIKTEVKWFDNDRVNYIGQIFQQNVFTQLTFEMNVLESWGVDLKFVA